MQVATQPQTSAPAPVPGGGAVPASLTDDEFLGGKIRCLQPEKGFRAGMDSVFLAATIPVNAGEMIFEAGIGAGIAALCLVARNPAIQITGIESAARYAMLCDENAKRNGFAPSVKVIHADVKDALRKDLANMPQHGSFAHAFANPPYFEDGKVTPSPSLLKAQANAFGADDLEVWIKVLHVMVAHRGSVTMINKADALGKILSCMEDKFGDIRVAPLYAREGMSASRVIVQGIKGSRAPLQLLPGLILHEDDNVFSPDAEAVLREGVAWRLR